MAIRVKADETEWLNELYTKLEENGLDISFDDEEDNEKEEENDDSFQQ